MIDCGSQRSYLSESFAKLLRPDVNNLYKLECNIDTYLGQNTKEFKQMSTGIKIGQKLVHVPLLIDSTFKVTYEVPGLSAVINKFKQHNVKLLDDTFNDNSNFDVVEVDLLLGVDVLQHMHCYTTEKLGGACMVTEGKYAPFGNILRFLDEKEKEIIRSSLLKQVEQEDAKTRTTVNAVMDPIKSYFNPLETILTDSEVDNGLEHLFSLESLGIKTDDKELVSIDQEQVDRFQEGIKFKDGHYHVELPWHQEKINAVPSNHNIALKVLDRTLGQLRNKNLVAKYEAVFDQQLADGIIEEIKIDPSEYKTKIWIPHRPVIKMEEQVTTKIRPVFNRPVYSPLGKDGNEIFHRHVTRK